MEIFIALLFCLVLGVAGGVYFHPNLSGLAAKVLNLVGVKQVSVDAVPVKAPPAKPSAAPIPIKKA